jgi:hypothetical protein
MKLYVLIFFIFTGCATQFNVPEGGYSDFITERPKAVLKSIPLEKTIEEKNEYLYRIFNWKIGNKITKTEVFGKKGIIDDAVIMEIESILRERGHKIPKSEKDATSIIEVKSLSFIQNIVIYKQKYFCTDSYRNDWGDDDDRIDNTPCIESEIEQTYKTNICLKINGKDEFCRRKKIYIENDNLTMRDLLRIELHKIAVRCKVDADCDK